MSLCTKSINSTSVSSPPSCSCLQSSQVSVLSWLFQLMPTWLGWGAGVAGHTHLGMLTLIRGHPGELTWSCRARQLMRQRLQNPRGSSTSLLFDGSCQKMGGLYHRSWAVGPLPLHLACSPCWAACRQAPRAAAFLISGKWLSISWMTWSRKGMNTDCLKYSSTVPSMFSWSVWHLHVRGFCTSTPATSAFFFIWVKRPWKTFSVSSLSFWSDCVTKPIWSSALRTSMDDPWRRTLSCFMKPNMYFTVSKAARKSLDCKLWGACKPLPGPLTPNPDCHLPPYPQGLWGLAHTADWSPPACDVSLPIW